MKISCVTEVVSYAFTDSRYYVFVDGSADRYFRTRAEAEQYRDELIKQAKRNTTVNIELRRRSREAGKPIIKKFPYTWVVYYPNGLYTEHATHREALHVAGRYLKETREQ